MGRFLKLCRYGNRVMFRIFCNSIWSYWFGVWFHCWCSAEWHRICPCFHHHRTNVQFFEGPTILVHFSQTFQSRSPPYRWGGQQSTCVFSWRESQLSCWRGWPGRTLIFCTFPSDLIMNTTKSRLFLNEDNCSILMLPISWKIKIIKSKASSVFNQSIAFPILMIVLKRWVESRNLYWLILSRWSQKNQFFPFPKTWTYPR